MADNTVSQASTSSGNVKRKPSSQDTPAKAKAKVKRTSKADDKQADSRHRALERQFSKAQRQAGETQLIPSPPLASTSGEHRPSPFTRAWSPEQTLDQGSLLGYERDHLSLFDRELRLQVQDSIPAAEPGPSSVSCGSQGEVTTVIPPPIPSASFTPMAAGLRGPEHPSFTVQLQAMISQAVAQAMAASGRAIPVQGPSSPPTPTETMHPREYVISDHGSPPQSEGSEISDYSAQIPEEGMWSDGEDIQAEATPMVGVFNPNSFYSLLQKAYVTGKIEPVKPQTTDQDSGQSSDPLFLEPVKKNLQIPCPPMFLKSIQDQWGSPGSFSALGGLDRKLLDTVPSLNDVLEVPGVDEALAPILSDTKIPGDMSEALKAEDKKSEISLKRTHQASAWAIRASTSNSFFARIALIWLRELQARISPDEVRVHQDVTKLRAALEYMADVSLQSAKYSARAIASNVAARRLFWLKNWKADTRHKWRVAAAPYQKGRLFGEALTPYLTENKEKLKVLAHIVKKTGRRFSPYNRCPSFKSGSDRTTWSGYRPFQAGPGRSSYRSGCREKPKPQFQAKRLFRGRGGHPFRTSK